MITLKREGDRFTAHTYDPTYRELFAVKGGAAARAAVRFLGLKTPVADYFYDSVVGGHYWNMHEDKR